MSKRKEIIEFLNTARTLQFKKTEPDKDGYSDNITPTVSEVLEYLSSFPSKQKVDRIDTYNSHFIFFLSEKVTREETDIEYEYRIKKEESIEALKKQQEELGNVTVTYLNEKTGKSTTFNYKDRANKHLEVI